MLIGVNVAKRRAFDAEAMADAIRAAVEADGLNARVVLHGGLVADYCAENGIRWYVRGLRCESDYAYEENNARINRLLNPDMETVYLRGDEIALSSSMVRELMAFGHSVAEYVPESVAKRIGQRIGQE